MSEEYSITALTGSTQRKSTSKSIVNYLQEQFSSHSIKTDIFYASEIYQDENKFNNLLTRLSRCELFLLCTPVYIDGLSYPLIRILEQLYSCKDKKFLQGKKMLTIVHSGFPEKIHRESAINICRHFAQVMEFEWQGAVGFGVTSIIEGKSLSELGIATRWIRQSLDEIVEAIVNKNEKLSSFSIKESRELPIPLPVPVKCFPPLLNFLMRRKARAEGVKDILVCPYSRN